MDGKIEKLESKEQPTSRIVLEFFRHGKKEKEKDGYPEYNVRLTPEGRQQADEKGKKLHPQPEIAIAVGSLKTRAQETAARVMLEKKEKITPDMSLEEIEKIIAQEQKFGKKITADPRLGFNLNGPVAEKIIGAEKEEKIMEYLVYKSDEEAKKMKDKETTTYSRYAGNIAELIKKYLNIAPNFDRIVRRHPDRYKKYNNQMERYFGTHLAVSESFLAKVLEKSKGIEDRNRFVDSVKNGFKETEGIRVEINTFANGQKIELKYKLGKKDESTEISPEILDEIIKERDELNRKIEEI